MTQYRDLHKFNLMSYQHRILLKLAAAPDGVAQDHIIETCGSWLDLALRGLAREGGTNLYPTGQTFAYVEAIEACQR